MCDFASAAAATLIERFGGAFVGVRRVQHASPDVEVGWIVTVDARGGQYETSPMPSMVAALQEAAAFLGGKPPRRAGAA